MRWEEALAEMGFSFSEEAEQRLSRFLDILKKWNAHHNLTAIRDISQMRTHHVLDSLSIAPYIYGNCILDVGSGAGFPGIPLALLFPDKKFTLLDSRFKKAAFLRQVVTELKMNNVTVVAERVESFLCPVALDSIITRALGKIPQVIEKTKSLLCSGGRWLIMKGAYPQEELQSVQYPVVVHRLHVPGLNAQRHLVEVIYSANIDRQFKNL